MATMANNTKIDWAQNQSTTIDALRLPLTIAVIFVHTYFYSTDLINTEPILSSQWTFKILNITFSLVLGQIAVPIFFLISGYLFFTNFSNWTWTGYAAKLKRRLWSLCIPYIIWNIVKLIFIFIKNSVIGDEPYSSITTLIEEQNWHLFYDSETFDNDRIDWLGNCSQKTAPIHIALWFLRDLIIVSLLAPIIYFINKRIKIWCVIIIGLIYISRIWPPMSFISITSIFFFNLGAYFAISKNNIAQISRKTSFITIPLSLLLLIPCIIYNGPLSTTGDNIFSIFTIIAVFCVFSIASYIVEKHNIKPYKLFINSCFFIYTIHTIGILGLTKTFLVNLFGDDSYIVNSILYLTIPFIVTIICIAIYYILVRFFPKISIIFTGNRNI